MTENGNEVILECLYGPLSSIHTMVIGSSKLIFDVHFLGDCSHQLLVLIVKDAESGLEILFLEMLLLLCNAL